METVLRIGELSRRSGVSPELLRAWERRYGLLRPTRSAGGLRLYSLDDLERVRQMRRHLDDGLAAAQAAALASRPARAEPVEVALDPASARAALGRALEAFDEPGAQSIVDDLLATATVDLLVTEVVLPYLHELGARWERGEVSVAQEHFASNVVRGRLLGLARGWGRGLGPLGLLACIPGERHDLGLLGFGLVLRTRGWRIAYLGADTPLPTLEATAHVLEPDAVVLTAVGASRLQPHLAGLRELAKRHRVALGGRGARVEAVRKIGALSLGVDLVEAAVELTAAVRADA
ncbi:MAG TPA: MerR family transcriptional regulator [Gaiellaceae bacterium]|jgi:DNA-binding transcriptional MerR regulator